MKNYPSFLICILFLAATFTSKAQAGWTVYDNTNTTLSSGTYKAISMDQSGNIWVEDLIPGCLNSTEPRGQNLLLPIPIYYITTSMTL